MSENIKFFQTLDYMLQYNLTDKFFGDDQELKTIEIIDIGFDFEKNQIEITNSDDEVLFFDMNIYVDKLIQYSEWTYWDWKRSYEDQKKHCDKMLSDLDRLFQMVENKSGPKL